jgi:hypothetical protein
MPHQLYSSIYDQALCATQAKVWVNKSHPHLS